MKANRLMKGALLAAVLVASCVGNAWADRHGHVRFGVVVGPGWGPYYSPYPYSYPYPRPYYYPPYAPVVVERTPPVYIEQAPAVTVAPPAATTNYWYYCAATRAYYPYVKECPGGWMQVLPQTPAQ